MKYISAALFSLASVTAHAATIHVEIGAGQTSYGVQSDGTWYQAGMPHRINSTGQAYMLGLTGDVIQFENYGVAWHADYVNLGAMTSDCRCTTIDADYDIKTRRLIRTPTPIAQYSGHGTAAGIKLSLAPYFQVGKWRFGAEAGLFPYRPGWHEAVYGWSATPGGPTVSGRHDTPSAWQLGKVVGIFVQREHLAMSYEFYRLPSRYDAAHNPALWTGAHVLMVSYTF